MTILGIRMSQSLQLDVVFISPPLMWREESWWKMRLFSISRKQAWGLKDCPWIEFKHAWRENGKVNRSKWFIFPEEGRWQVQMGSWSRKLANWTNNLKEMTLVYEKGFAFRSLKELFRPLRPLCSIPQDGSLNSLHL